MTQVLLCLCGVLLVPINSFVDSAQVLLASFCYRLSPFGAGGWGGVRQVKNNLIALDRYEYA